MDTPNTQGNTQSQAKLAAALASFLFFVPLLMDVRTPFVVKYMKQGFILNVASIVLSIVLSFVWMNGFGWLINLALFLTSLFLAIQAFNGKDYAIPFLLENAEKLIQTLGITSWFQSKI